MIVPLGDHMVVPLRNDGLFPVRHDPCHPLRVRALYDGKCGRYDAVDIRGSTLDIGCDCGMVQCELNRRKDERFQDKLAVFIETAT